MSNKVRITESELIRLIEKVVTESDDNMINNKKKMTQQKRRAEKKDPKIGTGNKPTMTHYDKK